MAVKINFNICDNSPECSGIAACDTGALFWDKNGINILGEPGVLAVNNSKCISCEKCIGEEGCPVGAIIFAPSDEELETITKTLDINEDQVRELFVDRYGAEPIDETICISGSELEETVMKNDGITVVECFADWSIQCLLSSIPINTILNKINVLCRTDGVCFFKANVTDQADEGQNLPMLLIYRDAKVIAKVEGYYTQQTEKDLLNLLDELL